MRPLRDNEIRINYWETQWGHVSLETNRIYASFFPVSAQIRERGMFPADYREDETDRKFEGKPATRRFIIRDLNVERINAKFLDFKASAEAGDANWNLFGSWLSREDQNCSGLVAALLMEGGINKQVLEFKFPTDSYFRFLWKRAELRTILVGWIPLFLIEDSIGKAALLGYLPGIPIVIFYYIINMLNRKTKKLNGDDFGSICAFIFAHATGFLIHFFAPTIDNNFIIASLILVSIYLSFKFGGKFGDYISRCVLGVDNLIRPMGIVRLCEYYSYITQYTPAVIYKANQCNALCYSQKAGVAGMLILIGKLASTKIFSQDNKMLSTIGLFLGVSLGTFMHWFHRQLWTSILERRMQIFPDAIDEDDLDDLDAWQRIGQTEDNNLVEAKDKDMAIRDHTVFKEITGQVMYDPIVTTFATFGMTVGVVLCNKYIVRNDNSYYPFSITILGVVGFFLAFLAGILFKKIYNKISLTGGGSPSLFSPVPDRDGRNNSLIRHGDLNYGSVENNWLLRTPSP